MVNHVLSVQQLAPETLTSLVDRAVMIANGDHGNKRTLAGKVVGIYFRGTSTRTRTAFSVGAMKLGADIISYGPNDLQINTGRSEEHTSELQSHSDLVCRL